MAAHNRPARSRVRDVALVLSCSLLVLVGCSESTGVVGNGFVPLAAGDEAGRVAERCHWANITYDDVDWESEVSRVFVKTYERDDQRVHLLVSATLLEPGSELYVAPARDEPGGPWVFSPGSVQLETAGGKRVRAVRLDETDGPSQRIDEGRRVGPCTRLSLEMDIEPGDYFVAIGGARGPVRVVAEAESGLRDE